MIKTNDQHGSSVMLDDNEEAIYMSDLISYQARKLYDILKDQQTERFNRLKLSGELIPYLNKITEPHWDMLNDLTATGTSLQIAEQLAWTDLAERVGL